MNILHNTKERDSFKGAFACLSEEIMPHENVKDKEKYDSYKKMSYAQSSKDPPFPVKLHYILSRVEFEDAVSWLPRGHAWRIKNADIFEKNVIPLFFPRFHFSSFMKHAGSWGFKKNAHGLDAGCYYHKLFLRDSPSLCLKIRFLAGQAKAPEKKRPELKQLEFSDTLHERIFGYEKETSIFEGVKMQHSPYSRHGYAVPPSNATSLNAQMSTLIHKQIKLDRARDYLQRSQAEISMHMRLLQQPKPSINPELHQNEFINFQGQPTGILSGKPISDDSCDRINSLRQAYVGSECKNKVLVEALPTSMTNQGKHREPEFLASLPSQKIHHWGNFAGATRKQGKKQNNFYLEPSPDQMQHQQGNASTFMSHK